MELAALVDLNNGQSYAQPLCADDGAIPFWLNTPKGNIFAWYHPAKLDNLDNFDLKEDTFIIDSKYYEFN